MDLKKNDRLREALAQEAAKIIATEGVRDYQQAKRKACERLGNSNHGSLPSNFEIERAVSSFQNTFLLNHDVILSELRKIALIVMHWLRDYSPYLVGSVLEGSASANTPISIHVSSDVIEEVLNVLKDYDVDTKIEEQRIKLGKESILLPTILFCYEHCEVVVTVFTLRQQHQLPKSKTTNRGIQRANIKNVEKLINQN